MDSKSIDTPNNDETDKVHVRAILRAVILQICCVSLGCLAATNHVINAYLGDLVVKPIYSITTIFILGTLVLFTISFVHSRISGRAFFTRRKGIKKVHWYEPLGGIFIAIAIIGGVYLIPQLGAATFCALALTGSLCSATVLDHRGALGLPVRKARYAAAISLLLVFLGLSVSVLNNESQPHTSMGIVPNEQENILFQDTFFNVAGDGLEGVTSETLEIDLSMASANDGEEQREDPVYETDGALSEAVSSSMQRSTLGNEGPMMMESHGHEASDAMGDDDGTGVSSGWDTFDFESEFEKNMSRLRNINNTRANSTHVPTDAEEKNDKKEQHEQQQQRSPPQEDLSDNIDIDDTPLSAAAAPVSHLGSPTTPPDGKPLMYAKLGFFALLAFLSGVTNPIGATLNWRLAKILPHKSQSLAFAYFVASLLALLIASIIFTTNAETMGQIWSSMVHTPIWAWAGLPGALVLLAGGVLLPRRVGTATYFVGLLVGEMAASLLFDGLGALGLEKRAPSTARVSGVLVVVAGAMCLRSADEIDAIAETLADKLAQKLGKPSRLRRRLFHTSTFGIVIDDGDIDSGNGAIDEGTGKEELVYRDTYSDCECDEKKMLAMMKYGKELTSPCSHCKSSTDENEGTYPGHNRHGSIVYKDLTVPELSGQLEDPMRLSPLDHSGTVQSDRDYQDTTDNGSHPALYHSSERSNDQMELTVPFPDQSEETASHQSNHSFTEYSELSDGVHGNTRTQGTLYSDHKVAKSNDSGIALDAQFSERRHMFATAKSHSDYGVNRRSYLRSLKRGERRMQSESDLPTYTHGSMVPGDGVHAHANPGILPPHTNLSTSSRSLRLQRISTHSTTPTMTTPDILTPFESRRPPSTRNLQPFDPYVHPKKKTASASGANTTPRPDTIELKPIDQKKRRFSTPVGANRRVLSQFDTPHAPRASFSQIQSVHSVVATSPRLALEETSQWEHTAGSKQHLVSLSRNVSGRNLIPYEYSPNQDATSDVLSLNEGKKHLLPRIKKNVRKIFTFGRRGSAKNTENTVPLIETLPEYKAETTPDGAHDHRLASMRKHSSMRDVTKRRTSTSATYRRFSMANASHRHIKQSSMNFIGTDILPDDD